jgi:hypothetical protein
MRFLTGLLQSCGAEPHTPFFPCVRRRSRRTQGKKEFLGGLRPRNPRVRDFALALRALTATQDVAQ